MKRVNEGKACDAIIRHTEEREGYERHSVWFPEKEGHPAPIELVCVVGQRSFAFEHTNVEPFEGQIELEKRAHFQPLRDMFSGTIPAGECYDLHVPAGATLDLKKAKIASVISTLGAWIRTEGPKLRIPPIWLKGTPVERKADASIPFDVALYRRSFPGATGNLEVIHRADDSRTARFERACQQKFPKLAVWKNGGARTILILEETDIQLSSAVDWCRTLLEVERSFPVKPDEVYLITTSIVPWTVSCLRTDNSSFFDLSENDRGWVVDPNILMPITGPLIPAPVQNGP
jgi:hypothetical protein